MSDCLRLREHIRAALVAVPLGAAPILITAGCGEAPTTSLRSDAGSEVSGEPVFDPATSIGCIRSSDLLGARTTAATEAGCPTDIQLDDQTWVPAMLRGR